MYEKPLRLPKFSQAVFEPRYKPLALPVTYYRFVGSLWTYPIFIPLINFVIANLLLTVFQALKDNAGVNSSYIALYIEEI